MKQTKPAGIWLPSRPVQGMCRNWVQEEHCTISCPRSCGTPHTHRIDGPSCIGNAERSRGGCWRCLAADWWSYDAVLIGLPCKSRPEVGLEESKDCRCIPDMSIGHVSISELADLVIGFRLTGVVRLDLRRLPCLLSEAAAEMAALEGVTPLVEALEFDRGRSIPCRFSTGGSSLAAFIFLSSVLAKVKEELRLGGCSLVSDSSSLVSLSKRPG